MTELDNNVRLHILGELVAHGEAPSIAAVARVMGQPEAEIGAAFERLAAGRVIVLKPGTRDVMMAAPFSAVPTPHVVHLPDGRSSYGNCIWDALGILAMVRSDGVIDTICSDCRTPLQLAVRNASLEPSDTVVHFAIPPARWWEDIVFT